MSVNTTTKYIVYNHNGGGVRHHHFGVQNDIIMEADGTATAPGNFPALGFPTLPFNGTDVPFAFMSVHGAADGNHLYTSPGNQLVPVGTTNIDVLVVYAPPGGIGSNGGPGVWVDAFNVDTGDFSDSLDFITVLTPPTPPDTVDAAKTTFGNMDGSVSTAAAENIRANLHVDGAPFQQWKRIVPTPTLQNTPQINLSQNETGEIWFAFYQTVKPDKSILKVREMVEAGIILFIGDDYCGNGGIRVPHRGPGPSPFKISLSKKVINSLNENQQKKLKGLMEKYPDIANAAHIGMSDLVGALKGISDVLGGKKQR